jgi:hypothetical protein
MSNFTENIKILLVYVLIFPVEIFFDTDPTYSFTPSPSIQKYPFRPLTSYWYSS